MGAVSWQHPHVQTSLCNLLPAAPQRGCPRGGRSHRNPAPEEEGRWELGTCSCFQGGPCSAEVGTPGWAETFALEKIYLRRKKSKWLKSSSGNCADGPNAQRAARAWFPARLLVMRFPFCCLGKFGETHFRQNPGGDPAAPIQRRWRGALGHPRPHCQPPATKITASS